MILVRDIVERIQNLYSVGAPSDDSRLSDRAVYKKALSVRNELLHRKISKKQIISSWSYQTLPCIEMEKINGNSCSSVNVEVCTTLRSKHKIPNLIYNLDVPQVKEIRLIDGSSSIPLVDFKRVRNLRGNKYTNKVLSAYILDSYLYLTSNMGPKVLSLIGLFSNPMDALDFPSFCEPGCNDCVSYKDREFYIDEDLVEGLIKICAEELIGVFGSRQEDNTNDSLDTTNG